MYDNLTVHQMTEAEKQQVCQWRYPGPYAVYDLPSFAEAQARGLSLVNPACADDYHAYYHGEQLVGYTRLKDQQEGIFVGIGVAPQLCNRGYGQQILATACDLAAERAPGKPLFLLVRPWNTRAVRCYEKAGFVATGAPFIPSGARDDQLFLKMIKKE